MGATIVHVLVLGSYLSTECRELCAAPVEKRIQNNQKQLLYVKLIQDEKENSDWIPEQSAFFNTDH